MAAKRKRKPKAPEPPIDIEATRESIRETMRHVAAENKGQYSDVINRDGSIDVAARVAIPEDDEAQDVINNIVAAFDPPVLKRAKVAFALDYGVGARKNAPRRRRREESEEEFAERIENADDADTTVGRYVREVTGAPLVATGWHPMQKAKQGAAVIGMVAIEVEKNDHRRPIAVLMFLRWDPLAPTRRPRKPGGTAPLTSQVPKVETDAAVLEGVLSKVTPEMREALQAIITVAKAKEPRKQVGHAIGALARLGEAKYENLPPHLQKRHAAHGQAKSKAKTKAKKPAKTKAKKRQTED